MDTQPLYDFSPLLRLMLLGAVIALGPLAWVWLRSKGQPPARRLAALTALTLFLTFDLVLFGAFTRLTDSGLGCPDWPGCYGMASPTGAHAQISQAQAAMPTGPVTHGKAWVEMIHRYLATAVGVLITTLAAATWWQHRRQALPVHPLWPGITLVWVCLQGAFGALTVTMKLFPAIVTAHLLGGMVLLALLCMQAVRYSQAARGSGPRTIPAGAHAWLMAALLLLALQVALGGWVSTNYAVLACTEFPACQGSAWPPMDWRQGFEVWRELGKTGDGQNLGFAALTAIHYAHRLMAYLVILVLAVLAWRLWRCGMATPARWIVALTVWQVASGVSNVVLGWPLLAAVAHTGGAAGLVLALTWTLCETRRAPAGQDAAQRAPRGAGMLS